MIDAFRTLRFKGADIPIHWQNKNGIHVCEGSNVHPGVRLLWTLCKIDVPANAAYLAVGPDPVTCIACRAAQIEGDRRNGSAA